MTIRTSDRTVSVEFSTDGSTWVALDPRSIKLVDMSLTPYEIRMDRMRLKDLIFEIDQAEIARLRQCGCPRCLRRANALAARYPGL